MVDTYSTIVDPGICKETNVTDQHQAPNLTAIKDRQQKT